MNAAEHALGRVAAAVNRYRHAPFASADWLAGEVMKIIDTLPANDIADPSKARGETL